MELFIVTQLFVVALKFSFMSVTAVLEFEVAEEVRFTDPPAQTDEADAEAVTDVGVGVKVIV